MILINISSTDGHDGDRRTCDRILKGIQGLTNSGYTVERYEHFTAQRDKRNKIILAVTRTNEANDSDFEAWLKIISNSNGTGPASGREGGDGAKAN